MTKLRVSIFFAALMILLLAACSSKPKIDVVNGRPMVSNTMADTQSTLEALAKLPAYQRADYLHQRHPDLAQRLVYFVRQRGKIQANTEVQGVDFFFGSLDKVKAEDGTGQVVQGYFKDQLVARVRVGGVTTPIDVLVRCMNGTFDLPGELVGAGFGSLGIQGPAERFTIGRNDNLVRHVGYSVAIDLAERHSIQLFRRGRGKDRRSITPAEARRLERETDRVMVAALVFEGDRFDLVAGTYTPAPKKTTPAKRATRRR